LILLFRKTYTKNEIFSDICDIITLTEPLKPLPLIWHAQMEGSYKKLGSNPIVEWKIGQTPAWSN